MVTTGRHLWRKHPGVHPYPLECTKGLRQVRKHPPQRSPICLEKWFGTWTALRAVLAYGLITAGERGVMKLACSPSPAPFRRARGTARRVPLSNGHWHKEPLAADDTGALSQRCAGRHGRRDALRQPGHVPRTRHIAVLRGALGHADFAESAAMGFCPHIGTLLRLPALGVHVAHVVELRAVEQVSDVAARRVVTTMEDVDAGRDRPALKSPDQAVSPPLFAVVSEGAVALIEPPTRPFKAAIRHPLEARVKVSGRIRTHAHKFTRMG